MNHSQYTNARLHSMMSRSRPSRSQLPQRAWGFVTAGIVLLTVATVWQFELFGFAGEAAYAQRPTSAPAMPAESANQFLPLISTAPGTTRSEANTAPSDNTPLLPQPTQRPPQVFTRTADPMPEVRTATLIAPAANRTPAPTQQWAEARDPFSATPVQVAAGNASAGERAPIQQVQQTSQAFDLFAAPAVDEPSQPASSPAAAPAMEDPFFAAPAVAPADSRPTEQFEAPSTPLMPLTPPAASPEPSPVFAPPAVESAPAQTVESQPDPFGFAPVETTPAQSTPVESAPFQAAPFEAASPAQAPPAAAPAMPRQTYTEDPYLNRPAPLAPLDRPSLSIPPATGVSMSQPAVAEERIYEVQPGDNYWSISRHFYGSSRYFAALVEYNRHRIPDPDKMRPGMMVLGPDPSILHERYPKLTGPDPSKPMTQQPSGFFVDQNGQPAFRVGKGDTLTSIAQLHLGRVSRWTQVYAMNKQVIRDPNNLKIDTILRLPADACQVQVVSGDSLLR